MEEINKENSEKDGAGFWLGLVIGGAIGAVGSYLLKSDNKHQAIEELREKGKDLWSIFNRLKDEVIDHGEETKQNVREEVVKKVAESKKKAEEISEISKQATEEIKNTVEEAVEEISQAVKKKEESTVKVLDNRKKGFGKFFFKKGNSLVKSK